VQVDGQINGDIHCEHLIVGKDATINGNICAEDVVVRGKVSGTIRANRITLQDTAVVESDIYHKSLTIEQGACFEGRSSRREEPMKAETDDRSQGKGGRDEGSRGAVGGVKPPPESRHLRDGEDRKATLVAAWPFLFQNALATDCPGRR